MGLFALRVLRIFGIWHSHTWTNPWRFIYKVFGYFHVFLSFTLSCSQLFYVIIKAENISDILASCPSLMLSFEGLIKLLILLTRKNEIERIIIQLSIVKADLKADMEEKIHKHYCTYSKLASLFFAIFYASCCILLLFKSFLDGKSAVKVWVPQWIEYIIPHWALYMYFRIAIFSGTLVLMLSKIIYVAILIQMSMHLDILHYRFSSIPKGNEEDTQKYIGHCIQYHLSLLECANNIQNTFLGQLSAEICAFGAKLCVNVIAFTAVNIISIQGVTALNYILATLGVYFLQFWEGNKVTLKSIAIGNSLYQTDWFHTEKPTAKMIMTIMHRSMMRPIIFTGILSISISNHTFTCILKASYEAFCVLRTVVANSASN